MPIPQLLLRGTSSREALRWTMNQPILPFPLRCVVRGIFAPDNYDKITPPGGAGGREGWGNDMLKKKKKNKANSGGEGKITTVEQSYNDGLRKRSKRRQSRCWINLLGRSCICRTSLFFSFGGRQSPTRPSFPLPSPHTTCPEWWWGKEKKMEKKKNKI